MNFFDMGPLEILLILVIALIIWGPGKIPDIARTLGRAVSALRKASFDLTTQIKNELEVEKKDKPSKTEASTGVEIKELPDKDEAESSDREKASPRDK